MDEILMTEQTYHGRMVQRCQAMVSRCSELNQSLENLTPLAKQMHLLSANAVSSATRAGSEGNAFRVLTQDIQLLGKDITECISSTELLMQNIMSSSANLAELSHIEAETQRCQACKPVLSAFSKAINQLSMFLDPLVQLVNKGKYLAVFSSVEAANAGLHGESFTKVADRLRDLVAELGDNVASQQRIMNDIQEDMSVLRRAGKH